MSSENAPEVEVVIEVPRGSFLKRDAAGRLEYISPFPCPFNYGSIESYLGMEGDLLDAAVLGPRLPRGARVKARAWGAVRLIDHGIQDDKIICSNHPIGRIGLFFILLFFRFYARCKAILNLLQRLPGRNSCEGWVEAGEAIARATPRHPE